MGSDRADDGAGPARHRREAVADDQCRRRGGASELPQFLVERPPAVGDGGAVVANHEPGPAEATPIARLTGEFLALVVRSPFSGRGLCRGAESRSRGARRRRVGGRVGPYSSGHDREGHRRPATERRLCRRRTGNRYCSATRWPPASGLCRVRGAGRAGKLRGHRCCGQSARRESTPHSEGGGNKRVV